MDKLILTTALTGAITVPTQTPHLPYTIEGIANDAIACAKAGSSSIHVHARNPENGHPSSDPEIVRSIVSRIKNGCDAIICITTGGGMGMTPQERLRGAALCQPELASFNLGSMNFSMHPVARRYQPEDWKFDWELGYVEGTKDFIFRNTFGDMEVFISTMKEHDIKPEFEAYDVGHLYNLKFLEKSGLIQPPYWIQFVLGVLGGLAATPEDLITMKQTADRLFGSEGYRWSVIGVGYPMEFNMAAMAIMMGGHVRVGLEDNVFVRRRELARNVDLVEKVKRIAAEFEREIATPAEAREMLRLKGMDAVNF
ncbi:MAG: 3-keto-5-aminohexanoate cleavage protein [Chloroflexi bacterium RBG_16_48_8]|nr:MAG: 3-keto-5-aminohexanoate cleavage protein [Chloroflexi bacterium RBG_16_48_8]